MARQGLASAAQQRLVAFMERPHRGDEMEGPIGLLMTPAQQLGSGAQQPHNKKRSSRQSDGWTGIERRRPRPAES